MSTTSKGTEYELLVQKVLNMLHAADGVEQICIKHDVKLTGLSGATHQIDLYWEFKMAGLLYRVAVECKNYAAPVSKGKITSFKGVLDDLGGLSGIYVCASGYQKGAKQVAEAYGIQLLEIRHPTDKDWNGRMRDVHIELHYLCKTNFHVSFVVDKEWVEQNHIDKPENFHGWTDKTIVEFANAQADGCVSKSLLDFIRELPSDASGRGFEKVYKYDDAFLVYREFDDSDQICGNNMEARFKILGFKIVYDVKDYVDNVDIYGDNIVMAIVKNLKEHSEKTVSWDGRVWDRNTVSDK